MNNEQIQLPIPDRIESPPNLEYVDVLKRVREELWDGISSCYTIRSQYICYLIEDRYGRIPLIDEIGHRLGRRVSYEGWLIENADVDTNITASGSELIQAARLRWINQLIEEYGGTP